MPIRAHGRKRPVDENKPWQAGWERRRYRVVRKTPGFPAVIALARAMNMLQFAAGATFGFQDRMRRDFKGKTPADERQLINAFFLTNAILHEAIVNVLPRVGLHYADHEHYQPLGALRKNKAWRRMIERNYAMLRNESVFHFDSDVLTERLVQVDGPFVAVASNRGLERGGAHYNLADVTALIALSGKPKDAAEYDRNVQRIIDESSKLASAFMAAAGTFLESVIFGDLEARFRQIRQSKAPTHP